MQNVKAWFTKNTKKEQEEFDEDEMMIEGDYWAFTHPNEVKSWNLTMILHVDNLVFNMKYKNRPVYLTLSFDEKVKNIIHDDYPIIHVQCLTMRLGLTSEEQYDFIILFYSEKINFNIMPLLQSLEPTNEIP